ncbi:MAG TPA: thioredoxin family protein [Puia sp.]|jgi:thiol-disulfide isomerase/thioredoxin|nr:thioredoxin family protein [Puia sp.]
MKRLLASFLILPFLANAQDLAQTPADTGVHFEHNLSWTAIRAKAKAENKYIFMDCFTTWCGPCRYMSANIFPQKESGDYMNDKFISVKVQLDTTAGDADNIRSWYQDGHDIAEKYGVRAYPTYLIFTPDGRIIHRMVGSRLTADVFVKDVSESFDSSKQYYTLLDRYKNGRRDTAFLHMVAMACLNAYDLAGGKPVADAWLATQSDLFSRDALYLQDVFTKKSTDKYFSTFTDHPADVDKILGPNVAETKVRNIFLSEVPSRRPGDNRPPDWAAIHKKIAAKLPAEADEMTARIKVNYYMTRKDWPDFEKAMVAYMKAYDNKMSDNELNSVAWSVFQNCPDMTCVSDVLDWSKRLKDNHTAAFVDTYANILYKLGKKDDAIALETKAISMASDPDKPSLQETLDKMKKGEKTW